MDQRLRVPARCTAVTPYSLSCSCYGEWRPWPARERVLLELSRDEGAKNCCGSPSPSGSTICAPGLAIPSRPWIRFRIDRGLPDHLACGFSLGCTWQSFRKCLKINRCSGPTPDLLDKHLQRWTQLSAGNSDGPRHGDQAVSYGTLQVLNTDLIWECSTDHHSPPVYIERDEWSTMVSSDIISISPRNTG